MNSLFFIHHKHEFTFSIYGGRHCGSFRACGIGLDIHLGATAAQGSWLTDSAWESCCRSGYLVWPGRFCDGWARSNPGLIRSLLLSASRHQAAGLALISAVASWLHYETSKQKGLLDLSAGRVKWYRDPDIANQIFELASSMFSIQVF